MLSILALVAILSAPVFSQNTACKGQSCWIADLSTSTGNQYVLHGQEKASGGSAQGDDCIRKCLIKLGHQPAPGLKAGSYGASTDLCTALTPTPKYIRSALQPRQSAACKPYSLLFARGTFDGGIGGKGMGLVGGPLGTALPSKDWYVDNIPYTNDMMGINCVGLPGGTKCVSQLNELAAKCPNTKIFTGGYSQGAMVARICTAYASEQAKKQIAGLVLFGDPFNGAGVKGIAKNKIMDYCNSGDLVCDGKLSITAGHMAYTGTETSKAAKWMQEQAKRA